MSGSFQAQRLGHIQFFSQEWGCSEGILAIYHAMPKRKVDLLGIGAWEYRSPSRNGAAASQACRSDPNPPTPKKSVYRASTCSSVHSILKHCRLTHQLIPTSACGLGICNIIFSALWRHCLDVSLMQTLTHTGTIEKRHLQIRPYFALSDNYCYGFQTAGFMYGPVPYFKFCICLLRCCLVFYSSISQITLLG